MTKLKTLLNNYDSWALPYEDRPTELEERQRRENFDFAMEIKPDRIAAIRAALPEIEPQIADLLDPGIHPFDPVRQLDHWWVDTGLQLALFPPVANGLKSLLFPNKYYAANDALAGAKWHEWPDHPLVPRLHALLRDLAFIMGEAIVIRRPDFKWAINEDATEKREQAMEWGKVVVMRAAAGDYPVKAFDMFNLARWTYTELHNRKRQRAPLHAVHVGHGSWRGSFLGWTVVAVVDGGYTPDHFPHGHSGPPVDGRWLGSPAHQV